MTKLVSERGIPLMLQEVPSRPVVTVEDYLKWYSLYVVFPDGRVEKVLPDESLDEPKRSKYNPSGTVYGDHNWQPDAVLKMCRRLGYSIDDRSFEVICGRWFREHLDAIVEDFPE